MLEPRTRIFLPEDLCRPLRYANVLAGIADYYYWEASRAAVPLFLKALALCKRHSPSLGRSVEQRFITYARIADLYYYCGELRKARRAYGAVFRVIELGKVVQAEVETILRTNNAFARAEMGDFDEALQQIQRAVELCRSRPDQKGPEIPLPQTHREAIMLGQRFAEAEPPNDLATLQRMEALHSPDKLDFWAAMLEGSAYAMRTACRIAEARSLNLRAIELRSRIPSGMSSAPSGDSGIDFPPRLARIFQYFPLETAKREEKIE
jgi:tetratricopeptide (TPR) repeat protein